MKKIKKATIARAATNSLARNKNRKYTSHPAPNYRVDVHVSSSATKKSYYNGKKRGSKYGK